MSSQNDVGFKGFIAAHAMNAFRFVKVVPGTTNNVIYAALGDRPIGVTQEPASINGLVNIKLLNCPGTFKVATEMVIPAGQFVSNTYSGVLTMNVSTISGTNGYTTLEASTGALGCVEIIKL